MSLTLKPGRSPEEEWTMLHLSEDEPHRAELSQQHQVYSECDGRHHVAARVA